jgi:hypothetical protein
MLSKPGRGALAVAFFLMAGCGGGVAEPADSSSEATQPPPQFSDEFVDGIGPEERAWLERQRRQTNGSTAGVEVADYSYAPIAADLVLDVFGGPSGAEVALAHPQAHRIQFLKGGAARVAVWDGARYLPHVFTAVESRQGPRICLARTRGWTGGCLTITTNGQDFRCEYLWNNGASGETACRVAPIRTS